MHLFILGMHRSGTSSVAGLSTSLGFYAGEQDVLIPPADDNPKGFWERLDVVAINDALLAAEGASWIDPLPYGGAGAGVALGLRMDRVLADLDTHGPWLIKDPRLCLTLQAWADRVRAPLIVFVNRAALPVARSLQHRNGLPIRYALALWELYTIGALRALVHYPHFIVDHADLLADPVAVTTALFQWAQRHGCSPISAPSREQVASLFDPALVHERQDPRESDRLLTPAQRHLEEGIGDRSLLQRVDELQLSRAAASLLSEFGGLAFQSDQASVLGRECKALRSAKAALQRDKRRLQAEVQALKSEFGATLEVLDQALNPATGSKLARLIDVINRSSKLFAGRRDALTSFDQVARILASHARQQGPWGTVGFVPRPRIRERASDAPPLSLPLRFPPTDHPKVSILVPVYNHYQTTLRCLDAILRHTPRSPGYEVIIADDCSDDETRAIEETAENLRVHRQDSNLGFLKNCNGAAAKARGEYLLLLNNDTLVQPGWLEALIEAMESDQGIGMAGPKFVFPDGILQEAGGIVWQDASGWNYGRDQNPDAPEYNYQREVDYVSGACLIIRRALWSQLGGFDEQFAPAYYEDTDLAFRVRAYGRRVVYVPSSEVVHFEGVSHGTDTASGVKHHQERNRELFLKKWRQELNRFHFPNGDSVFQARDRSRNRKTILVIDHYVPQYDRDAGSRSTWQYLKLFVDQGHQVKFMGDNFVRHEPYTSELQKMGVEVLYGSAYARHWKSWLRDAVEYIDLVYLHRPHITEKYIGFISALRPRPRLLYFGHDLHYLRAERQLKIEGDESKKAESEDWHRRELAIIDAVDVSFFPSAREVELLKEQRPYAAVKRLPLNIWPEPPQIVPPYTERNGLLFVGSFNHPPNLDGIRWFLAEVWPLIRRQIPSLDLNVVGSNAPVELFALGSDQILVRGHLPDQELEALYQSARIAVVPLRYGAGVKGKVLEALFQGVPVVTTPIGAEGIEDAEAVMAVCDGAGALADALVASYLDETRWTRMSRAGRALIRDRFCADAVVRLIGEDFLFPDTGDKMQ